MKNILVCVLLFAVFVSCTQQRRLVEGLNDINGTRLYCKTSGHGEPILIIHGGPGLNYQYLYSSLQPLSDQFRLVFYDQRVCGQSSRDVDTSDMTLDNFVEDIEGIRKALRTQRLSILAHSWGGLLAMKYAVKYPERVKTLVLVSSNSASSDLDAIANVALADRLTSEDSLHRVAIFQSEEFRQGKVSSIDALMRIGFRHQFYQESYLDSLDLALNAEYATTGRLLQHMAGELRSYDFHTDLNRITCPTLLIYGDFDPLTEWVGEKLHASIVGSQLEIIPDCGHFPFIEKQSEFAKIVTAFMQAR